MEIGRHRLAGNLDPGAELSREVPLKRGEAWDVSESEDLNLQEYLSGGRQLLQTAADIYERRLTPADYWWMGIGLAAITLAELSGRSYAVSRVEQLVDRLGYKGLKGDWLQRFVEELAELDAEGLLWPVYQRSPDGPVEPTGLEITAAFDAESAYFLTLAHIGVAVALHRDDQPAVQELADQILALVEQGRTPEREASILRCLKSAR